jgi:hypothetical protein
MDATKSVRPNDGVPPMASLADTEQEIETDGLGRVANWLSSRISMLNATSTRQHQAHQDGIQFLLMRCWETILAINLMHDDKDTNARIQDGQTSNLRKTVTQGTRSARQSKDKWHSQRKRAYSALGIFLNFGVAGWFVCHHNHRRYNLQDLMSLFHLAQEMALNKVTINSKLVRNRVTSGTDPQQPVHRSWERVNDYLIDLLLDTGVRSKTINWRRAAARWDRALTEANLAPLILKDFFTEVLTPGDTLSSSGDAAPLPQVNERLLTEWQARARRALIPISRHAAIQERFEMAQGIIEQTLGEPEITEYHTEGSEPDAEGEDDDGDGDKPDTEGEDDDGDESNDGEGEMS